MLQGLAKSSGCGGGGGGGPEPVNMLFPGPSQLCTCLDLGASTFPVNPSLVIGWTDYETCSVVPGLREATPPFWRLEIALLRVFIKRLFP